jgi:hypothetical protein
MIDTNKGLRWNAFFVGHFSYGFLIPGLNPSMQLPVVPVIDINKLPRYGVLAPPIDRPEKQAGKHVDLDRATQVFVKNRGALREATEGKSGGR